MDPRESEEYGPAPRLRLPTGVLSTNQPTPPPASNANPNGGNTPMTTGEWVILGVIVVVVVALAFFTLYANIKRYDAISTSVHSGDYSEAAALAAPDVASAIGDIINFRHN